MAKPHIQVAIALLFHQNQVLVGWREAKQHQGNKHEFPGGKVESGETAMDACRRETLEEVGIDIQLWHSFDDIYHEYEDVIVSLHLFHASVTAEQCQKIQAPWTWYSREVLHTLNFPKANQAIIARLQWPHILKISDNLNELTHLDRQQYMYWRHGHSEQQQSIMQLDVHQFAQLIVNLIDWKLLDETRQKSVAAVHLRQNQLMQMQAADLSLGVMYIAACHDEESLQHAQGIGCDAVILSPIQSTQTHEGQQPLGWHTLNMWAKNIDIPIYALGGLSPQDVQTAQQFGAYGVAGIRAF